MSPKAKKTQKPAGAAVNGKSNKSTPPTETPPSETPPATGQEEIEIKATTGTGKPDQAAYQTEQDQLKSEIDALHAKLVWHLTLCIYTGSHACIS